MFYVCSFDLYHLRKTKSPCNLKKKKLFIDNVSFVHNHMFVIRQTPKTRGHIMDSSTGGLNFNLELWLFTNLSYQISTYTTDTTFCDACLEVNVSSFQFINEHSNAAWLLTCLFSDVRKYVFLFDLILDIITISFIY